MYKEHFRSWGLRKNLTSDTAKKVRFDMHRGAVVQMPVIHGRVVGPKKLLKSYRIAPRTSSPFLPCPQSPGTYLDTEKCIHAALSYTNSHFDSGRWSLSQGVHQWAKDDAFCWWLELGLVQKLSGLKRGSQEGFELLGRCFDRYNALLSEPSPTLLSATYISIVSFYGTGLPELASSLLKHVVGLSSIRLGGAHPYTRLWSNLLSLDSRRRYEAGAKILEAHWDIVKQRTSPDSHYFETLPYNATLQLTSHNGLFTPEARFILGTLRRNIARYINFENEYRMQAVVQAAILADEDQNDTATAKLETLCSGMIDSPSETPIFLYLQGRILVRLGKFDKGIELLSRALSMASSGLLDSSSNLIVQIVILAHLQYAHSCRRNTEALHKVDAQFRLKWKCLATRIKAGNTYDETLTYMLAMTESVRQA